MRTMLKSAHYNPWQPLLATHIEGIMSLGMCFWVVQRFQWPDLAPGTAFICCPYSSELQAQEHAAELSPGEGKLLVMPGDREKINRLLDPESGFTVYLNTFKDTEKKWAKKVLDHYKPQIVAFVKSRTNLSLRELDIKFKFVNGRLKAFLFSGERSLEVLAHELIS